MICIAISPNSGPSDFLILQINSLEKLFSPVSVSMFQHPHMNDLLPLHIVNHVQEGRTGKVYA